MSRWLLGLLGMSVALAACGGKVLVQQSEDPEADTRAPTESWEDVPCGSSAGMQDAGSGSGWECDIPSNGCDFCGNVTCPSGASLDSACRCLVDGHGYVTPISQTCDFCCGKTCKPGQFLDFECCCY
jgi:hypothetical protein